MSEKDIEHASATPSSVVPLLGYRPNTYHRGRGAQIVERLRYLSRSHGIAHTAMAKLLQDDARELENILREFVP